MVTVARALAAVVTLILSVSCSSGNGTRDRAAVEEISQEEYAVYSAVLRVEAGAMRGDRIILQEKTIPFSQSGPESDETIDMYLGLRPVSSVVEKERVGDKHYQSVVKEVEEFRALISISLVNDFLRVNETAHQLENQFDSDLQVTLFSSEDHDTVSSGTRGSFWKSFYAKYPGAKGTFVFSRVGFDEERTTAFVYYQYVGGALAAEGVIFLLEKKDGRWQVVKRVQIWVS